MNDLILASLVVSSIASVLSIVGLWQLRQAVAHAVLIGRIQG